MACYGVLLYFYSSLGKFPFGATRYTDDDDDDDIASGGSTTIILKYYRRNGARRPRRRVRSPPTDDFTTSPVRHRGVPSFAVFSGRDQFSPRKQSTCPPEERTLEGADKYAQTLRFARTIRSDFTPPLAPPQNDDTSR